MTNTPEIQAPAGEWNYRVYTSLTTEKIRDIWTFVIKQKEGEVFSRLNEKDFSFWYSFVSARGNPKDSTSPSGMQMRLVNFKTEDINYLIELQSKFKTFGVSDFSSIPALEDQVKSLNNPILMKRVGEINPTSLVCFQIADRDAYMPMVYIKDTGGTLQDREKMAVCQLIQHELLNHGIVSSVARKNNLTGLYEVMPQDRRVAHEIAAQREKAEEERKRAWAAQKAEQRAKREQGIQTIQFVVSDSDEPGGGSVIRPAAD